MKYVIIGNSAAGIGAVEGIRRLDKESEITVISDEAYHTYSRPLISYYLLGKSTEESMKYRNNQFYTDNNCKLITSKKVIKINPEQRTVTLEDGGELTYDKLLVGTGSSPFVPPVSGLDTVENKFTFMSMDDMYALEKVLNPNAKVLIVGAGLIGLKCAEGIFKKVAKITVVDLADKILSSILDNDGAATVQSHLESKGIEFKLSQSISNLNVNKATLSNGEVQEFDILVLAVGVRPNTQLLQGIAEVRKGIVVNSKGETTAKNIYAAGDCTESLDISSGDYKIMALLPNAYMQGECAGANMAGGEENFDKAIPMNAIGFFGLHIITAGNYSGGTYTEKNTGYKKLFYGNNKLNGFILIGNIEKAGIYTSLIREQTPLDSIDFDLVCKKPGLMAFTKDDRIAKLGGGVR